MQFFNKTDDKSVSIDINDEIGFWGVRHQELKAKLDEYKDSEIQLNISSLGGDVNHAFAIYNCLKSHNSRIVANIYGDAASAATIIALGADEVRMADNVFFMIHNVWTMAVGNADEMREQADLMDKFDEQIKNVYKKKTGLNKNKITSLMKNETWFNAKEAKEHGFIDKITDATEILNRKESVIMNSVKNKEIAKELINKINNNKSTKMEDTNQVAQVSIDADKVADTIFNKVVNYFKNENKEVPQEKIQEIVNAESEKIKSQFQTSLTEAENSITKKDTELKNLQAKNEELAKENAKLQATATETEDRVDTEGSGDGNDEKFAHCAAIKNLIKKQKQFN